MPLDTHIAREQMISQQLRTWGVLDERVLDAVRKVAREKFVPAAYQALAFADENLPLPHDQVMPAPKLEARILQTMNIQPTEQVWIVGAGSGHLAACAAQLAYKVRVTDAQADMANQARRNLQTTLSNNVFVDNVDALQLDLNKVYDVIIVTGSTPSLLPQLERALNVGGRLFLVVGQAPVMQAMKITRTDETTWQRDSLFETELPRLSKALEPNHFVF
jgi:protein-L-isoaspartate(D-aspartate) O-methyltransferase